MKIDALSLFIPLLSLSYQSPVMAELTPLVAATLAVWDAVTQPGTGEGEAHRAEAAEAGGGVVVSCRQGAGAARAWAEQEAALRGEQTAGVAPAPAVGLVRAVPAVAATWARGTNTEHWLLTRDVKSYTNWDACL